ncbi:MAG TPA: aspartate-semialdehyde dehydrogenase [Longimicrobiales bacterium]|nr:aspartate-semialdehyde dehydrogenase [Longimicrobiales bacterium]
MRVAILGATGAVGRTMLQVLEERKFPIDVLVPLASARSAGTDIAWGGRSWRVQVPEAGSFRDCEVALFSAGATRSRDWAPRAAAEGALVIDNSSAWRMDPGVPLVVPEVNAEAAAARPRGIIANPNCATIQLVMPLAGLQAAGGLQRVVVTTLQSVSGAGHRGSVTLEAELAGKAAPDSPFRGPIAGNVIPWIGERRPDGWNEEEDKIRQETRKILGLPELAVVATCVRVPVRVGHSISATAQLERALPRERVLEALGAIPNLVVHDAGRDPLPAAIAGRDTVHVGHVRIDPDDARVVHLWIVADNLRKGAATNAVQIAESVLAARAGAR